MTTCTTCPELCRKKQCVTTLLLLGLACLFHNGNDTCWLNVTDENCSFFLRTVSSDCHTPTTETSNDTFNNRVIVVWPTMSCFADWLTLFSWWRKRMSGYLEESTTIQPTSCADCSRSVDGDSSTVCGVVHMTDKCPITQDTWPIKTS